MDIPRKEEYLEEIGEPFDSSDPLGPIMGDFSEDHLTFVIEGSEERPRRWLPLRSQVGSLPSNPCQFLIFVQGEDRYMWCAFSGLDAICRVNVGGCRIVGDLRSAIMLQAKLDIELLPPRIWKVVICSQ